MKALTIKQPWAQLIAYGIKDIENRTRPTNYRGRIAIHAGMTVSFERLVVGLTPFQLDRVAFHNLTCLDADLAQKDLLMSPVSAWLKSAIIGEVEIVDCVIGHPSIWAERAPRGEKTIYNWVLKNAILYEEPILNVSGKQSFWNYTGTPPESSRSIIKETLSRFR